MNWLSKLMDILEQVHMGKGDSYRDILAVLVKCYGYELKEITP